GERAAMNDELLEILDRAAASAPFERLLSAPSGRRVFHAAPPGHAFVAATLARALGSPVLLVAADPRSAGELAAGARTFLGPGSVLGFPAWESLPYEGISPAPSVAGERARAAFALQQARGTLVVAAPVLAALQGLSPDLGAHEPLPLAPGLTLPSDALAEQLAGLGYVRADVVEHRGEFAVRGGIVDVFPSTTRRPLRAEFFGEEIESLREFSPGTQLSTGRIASVEIHPSRELLPTEDVRRRAEAALPRFQGQYRGMLERLSGGLSFEGMELAIPLLYEP